MGDNDEKDGRNEDDGFVSGQPTPRDGIPGSPTPSSSHPCMDESIVTSTPRLPRLRPSSRSSLQDHFPDLSRLEEQSDDNPENRKTTLETIGHLIKVSRENNELKREKQKLRMELMDTSMQLNDTKRMEQEVSEIEKRTATELQEKDKLIAELQGKLAKVNAKKPLKRVEVTTTLDIRKLPKQCVSTQESGIVDELRETIREREKLEERLRLHEEQFCETHNALEAALNGQRQSENIRVESEKILETLNKENEELSKKVASLLSVIESMQTEKDGMMKETSDIASKLREAEGENEILDVQVNTLSTQVSDMKVSVDELNKERDEWKRSEMDLMRDKERVEREKEELEKQREELLREIEIHKEKVAGVHLSELTIRDMEREMNNMKRECETQRKEREVVERKLKDSEAGNRELIESSIVDQTKREEAQRQLGECMREKERLEKRLRDVDERVQGDGERDRQVEEMRREKMNLQEEVYTLKQENEKHINELDFLRAKTLSAPTQETVHNLEQRLAEMERETVGLRECREEMEKERESKLSCISRIAELEGELKGKNIELEKKEKGLEDLVLEQVQLHDQLKHCNEEIGIIKNNYDEYKMNAEMQYIHEVEQRDMQIESLRRRLSELEDYPGRDFVLPPPFNETRTIGEMIPEGLKEAIDKLKMQSSEMAALMSELERTRVDTSVGPSRPLSVEGKGMEEKSTSPCIDRVPSHQFGSLADSQNDITHNSDMCEVVDMIVDELKKIEIHDGISPNLRDLLIRLLNSVQLCNNNEEMIRSAISRFFSDHSTVFHHVVDAIEHRSIDAEQKLEELNGNIRKLQRDFENEREAYEELSRQNRKMEDDSEKKMREMDAEMERIRRKLVDSVEKISTMNEQMEGLMREKRELEEDVERKRHVVTESKELIELLRNDVNDGQHYVEELSERLGKANKIAEEKERRILELERQINDFHCAERENIEERTSLMENVDRLSRTISELREEIGRDKQIITECDVKIERLRKEVDILKERERVAEKEREMIEASKGANQRSVYVMETSLKKMDEFVGRLREEHRKKKEVIREVSKRVSKMVQSIPMIPPQEELKKLKNNLSEQLLKFEETEKMHDKELQRIHSNKAQHLFRDLHNYPAYQLNQ